VKSHYEILEDTLLAFPLPPWAKSVRKRLVAHPKCYFLDLGVVNAINRRLDAEADPRSRGRLFESFFVLEVRRYLEYAQSEASLYFWRTSAGAEVDLLLEKHGAIRAACEIKSSQTVDRASLRGIFSFREELPDVACLVACATNSPYEIDGVRVLPWRIAVEELRSKM
jgi:predicted AAA+ superfamily ATPase